MAVLLGALHALEPGHAKSLMAAYLVAIRGTVAQAVTLGLSAAVGHTIIVWGLAIAGLILGEQYIVEQAEPWLTLLETDDHDHGHDHHHDHDHGATQAGHHHAPAHPVGAVTTRQIIWFGFTGGLMPCPSAVAVLLVCIQIKAFALGVVMVAAFSVGLAATLVGIGISVAWGSGKLIQRWSGFDRWAARLPYLSAGLVMFLGLVISVFGLNATGLLGIRNSTPPPKS